MASKFRSGKDDFLATLLALAAGAVSVLFLINSLIVNRHFSAKYNVAGADIRVTDSGNILRFGKELLIIGFLVILLVPVCIIGEIALVESAREFLGARFPGIDAASLKLGCDVMLAVLAIISTGAILLVCLGISAHIGTSQIGMLIFPEKGIFVIPADPSKNTFVENVFMFQWLKDRFSMEELTLKDVDKITRQSGSNAYVHGKFGSRRIEWRNKQKRDECIATLERACKRRLSSADFAE